MLACCNEEVTSTKVQQKITCREVFFVFPTGQVYFLCSTDCIPDVYVIVDDCTSGTQRIVIVLTAGSYLPYPHKYYL